MPYSPLLGQGVCDFRQARGVRDMSKTVSFLCEFDSHFARLTGHVLVAIQDHLRGEWRMSADLHGDVAPLRVEDMKRIVVHIWHRLLAFDVMVGADIPDRRLSAAN